MGIMRDGWRAKTGQSMIDMENQARGAIAQLKQIKANLNKLKTDMQADTETFGADDIAEVDTMLSRLDTAMSNI